MPKLHPFAFPAQVRFLVLALAMSGFLAGAVVMTPGAASAQGYGRPVGHVSMTMGKGGFILSMQGGSGTLTFRGRRYPFRIGGLGVGTFGGSKIEAYGEVYGLRRVADFPGSYFQAEASATAIKGQGVQWLKNTHGVVLSLRSRTKGFSLNLGGDGLVIEMGPMKK